MAHYLVTGVAGFIGSAVAKALVARGNQVVGLDNLSTGLSHAIPPNITFHKADCLDSATYAALLPQHPPFDAIVHIAGQYSDALSFSDPIADLRNNAESTLYLLRFSQATGCRRFIYASSMSVYGNQTDPFVTEEVCPSPQSFYGVSKLAAEQYLRLYEARGISTTALRLFSVYGPGQNPLVPRGMVNIFLSMMLQEGHIHIKGSPNRYRDFVYIDDVVAAFLNCLDKPQSGGQCINVGSGCRVAVGTLVNRLCDLHTTPVTTEYSGHTQGDIYSIHADISMAAKFLGYEPAFSLEEGLRRMYEWYIARPGASQ